MNIPAPYIDFGAVSIEPLLAYLARLTEADWNANTYRQDRFAPHRQTRSILVNRVEWWDATATDLPQGAVVRPLITPLMDKVRTYYGEAEANLAGCMIVSLPPGAVVHPHNDSAPYFKTIHRCHVPLVTHERVQFDLGGERLHLAQGHLYEINNVAGYHACQNFSPIERVHLIFDVQLTGEQP
jgi:hypothetical protein